MPICSTAGFRLSSWNTLNVLNYTAIQASILLPKISGYVKRAARELSLSENDVRERLRLNYDGYCFDADAVKHVYNPWSVLHFLDRPKAGFANYWMSTGGQSTLWRQFFKDHSLRDPAEFQQLKRLGKAALQASVDEEEISDVALLTQTGYLTIKDVRYGDY